MLDAQRRVIHEIIEAFVEGDHPKLPATPEAFRELDVHLERRKPWRLLDGRIAVFGGDRVEVEELDQGPGSRRLLLNGFQGWGLALCVFHNFILYSKIVVVKFAFCPELVSFFGTRRTPCLRFEIPSMVPSR